MCGQGKAEQGNARHTAVPARTWWSPRVVGLPSRGTPRLAMSSVVPGCVPAGIFSSTGPSTVVTLTCDV